MPEAAPSGGPVVLDIGGSVGALIVYLPENLAGTEIEIFLINSEPFRTHTGVHPRGRAGRLRQTAVSPALEAGSYQLWHPVDGRPLSSAKVSGNEITQLDLG